MLQKKLTELSQRVGGIETQLRQEKERNSSSDKDREALLEEIKSLKAQYARAERVAAHIEQQIKVFFFKNNLMLYYHLLTLIKTLYRMESQI